MELKMYVENLKAVSAEADRLAGIIGADVHLIVEQEYITLYIDREGGRVYTVDFDNSDPELSEVYNHLSAMIAGALLAKGVEV